MALQKWSWGEGTFNWKFSEVPALSLLLAREGWSTLKLGLLNSSRLGEFGWVQFAFPVSHPRGCQNKNQGKKPAGAALGQRS